MTHPLSNYVPSLEATSCSQPLNSECSALELVSCPDLGVFEAL